jgi:hypothetical protein
MKFFSDNQHYFAKHTARISFFFSLENLVTRKLLKVWKQLKYSHSLLFLKHNVNEYGQIGNERFDFKIMYMHV